MFKGFRAFLLRGNVVDLAVAVVIGVAFTAVVTAFTGAFITPLIAVLFGKGGFSALSFNIRGVDFPLYVFINALFAFVITAAIVYYLVVTPVNALIERNRRAQKPADPTTKKCPECLSEIPIEARRCAFCTQPQPA
jgi:large conductance mechanosensitive channel